MTENLTRFQLQDICSEEGYPVASWEWNQGLEHGLRTAFAEARLQMGIALMVADFDDVWSPEEQLA